MGSSRLLTRTGSVTLRRTVHLAQPVAALVRPKSYAVLVVAQLAWIVLQNHMSGARAAEAEKPPEVPEAVDGRFLGLEIQDQTRDHFIQNPWLRKAIQDGRRVSDAFRRHQLDQICLLEGQHGDSGESAVMIMLVPKPHEIPDPPFEPVAVRRWQPEPGKVYTAARLAELQLSQPPHPEDLDRLRNALSGHRYREVSSLFSGFRIMLGVVIVGGVLIVLAGAYRCFAYVTSRWDPVADAQQHDTRLRALKAARARHEEQQ
jgi:hypothetical protein